MCRICLPVHWAWYYTDCPWPWHWLCMMPTHHVSSTCCVTHYSGDTPHCKNRIAVLTRPLLCELHMFTLVYFRPTYYTITTFPYHAAIAQTQTAAMIIICSIYTTNFIMAAALVCVYQCNLHDPTTCVTKAFVKTMSFLLCTHFIGSMEYTKICNLYNCLIAVRKQMVMLWLSACNWDNHTKFATGFCLFCCAVVMTCLGPKSFLQTQRSCVKMGRGRVKDDIPSTAVGMWAMVGANPHVAEPVQLVHE